MKPSINTREAGVASAIETSAIDRKPVTETIDATSHAARTVIEMKQLSHADRMAIAKDAMINIGGYSFDKDER